MAGYGYDSYTKLLVHGDGLSVDPYMKLLMLGDGTDGATTPTDDATAKTVTNTAVYDSYTKLCSHFDGADEARAYTDPIAGAYTFAGTTDQLDTAQKKFGTASLLLDGDSDWIELADSADWSMADGDFTIDFWIRLPDVTVSDKIILSQFESTDPARLWYAEFTNNGLYFYFAYGAVGTKMGYYYKTGLGWANNTWHHVAFVRNSTTGIIFVDGVDVSATEDTAFSTNNLGDVAGKLKIGAYGADASEAKFLACWIDELRISKGIARWTADFDQSLGNLLYNGNFEDWAAGAAAAPDGWINTGTIAREGTTKKIGTYAVKLTNGVDDNALLYQSSIPVTTSSTYTFGCWVYASAGSRARLSLYDGANNYSDYHTSTTGWEWLTVTKASATATVNVYCIIETGSAIDVYFDGAICLEAASIASTTDTNYFTQSPLVQPYGQVVISTVQKKFGTGSLLFDGAASNLSLADSADWDFGSGDFTIDMWVYLNKATGGRLLTRRTGGAGDRMLDIYVDEIQIVFGYSTDGTAMPAFNAVWAPVIKTWYHITFVRSGNNFYIFVNGTQIGTTGDMTGITLYDSSSNLVVGAYNDGGTISSSLYGYIDELRISKGVARWTEDFDPYQYINVIDDVKGKLITNTTTYDSYTVLCSHFDGSQGAGEYTDPVAGAYNSFEAGAQLSVGSGPKFGTTCLSLNGTTGYIHMDDSADWNFGTGDFTIDCWVRFISLTGAQMIVSQYEDATNYWSCHKDGSNNLVMYFTDGTDKGVYTTAAVVPFVINQWYHLTFVRSTTAGKIFVNGISQTLTENVAFSTNNVGDIVGKLKVGARGADAAEASFFNGYIDELRISKGIARWTADFDQSLGNLLYNGNFEDCAATVPDGWALVGAGGAATQSTTQKKIGTYSGKLVRGGTNCYIFQDLAGLASTYAGTTVYFGAWVYASSVNAFIHIYDDDGSAGSKTSHSATEGWEWLTCSRTIKVGTTAFSVALGVENADETAYIDGAILLSSAVPDSNTDTNYFTQSPLVQPYGQVRISTVQKKFGTGSLLFDGGGSLLTIGDNADWTMGTGAFTVDFWVNLHNQPNEQAIIGLSDDGYASTGFVILKNEDRTISVYSDTAFKADSTTALVAGTWYHVAVVGNGSSVKLYINGTLEDTWTINYDFTDNDLDIGKTASSAYFGGYIDELRISKGVARWTEDFDVATSEYALYLDAQALALTLNAPVVMISATPTALALTASLESPLLVIFSTELVAVFDLALTLGDPTVVIDRTHPVDLLSLVLEGRLKKKARYQYGDPTVSSGCPMCGTYNYQRGA